MATKKYLVKLIPHDKFFFGGEKTFGENNQANYYVVSKFFPQQTGVLGLIRHQLLLQCDDKDIFKNNKIVDNKLAKKLIGEKSFSIGEGFRFGKIISLSPVFISDSNAINTDDSYYFPANKEYHWHEKMDDNCKSQLIREFLQINLEPYPLLNGYDAKFGLPDLLMNKEGKLIKYMDVFAKHKQVGIKKKYNGGTDDNAYYIQTFYKFKKGFSFSFILELDADAKFKSQDITAFGAEQQAFKMHVADFEGDKDMKTTLEESFLKLTPIYEKSTNSDKVVLVNDAYVSEDIIQYCTFAITETIDFKFLKTEVSTPNHYSKPNKSIKYNLYKKGSVFYGNTDEIIKCLDNKQFNNIGYNIYKVIKS